MVVTPWEKGGVAGGYSEMESMVAPWEEEVERAADPREQGVLG